jgi:hypothetical protein
MDRALTPPSKSNLLGPDRARAPPGKAEAVALFGDDAEDDDGDLLAGQSVFQVIGTNCQILNIQLQPKQTV